MAAATGTAIAREFSAVSAPPLRVSFSWTLAGNVIYAACQFGMLSVLAKLGSPSIVGQYALGLAITAPVFMLTNLQLRGVQATDAHHEFAFADYFTLRTISTLLGTLVILLITAFAAYDIATKTVIVLVACAKAIETISDVIAGHLQKSERLDQVARALMIRGTVSVAIFAAVFWVTRNLITTAAALALAWAAVIILYDFRVVSRLLGQHRRFFRFSLVSQKSLLSISWPLGAVMTLGSLNINVPRYVLQHYMGPRELGIFASLAYLSTSVGIVITALGQSALARLSKMFAERQFAAFISLIRKFVLFGLLLGVVGVPIGALLGRQLISILYRSEYANHLNVFLVMIATTSVVAVASFLGYGVTSARSFKMPVLVVGASVVATVIVSLFLVPKFGLMGATLGLLIASVVQAIGLALLMSFEISRARRTAYSSIAKRSFPDINQPIEILSKGAL